MCMRPCWLPFSAQQVAGAALLLLLLIWPGGQCLAQQVAGARAFVINGFVYDVAVTNGGSGYSVPPTVSFSGGGGSGAAATVEITNGTVFHITIRDAGTGYTIPPTVVIEPPLFDLSDRLVGYWPFEGNVSDRSGYNQHGTVSGSILYPVGAVKLGAAISGTSYVSFGDPSDGRFDIGLGQDFSAALWVKTTDSSARWFPMLLTKDTGWNNDTRMGWLINFDNNGNGVPAFGTLVPPPPAAWGVAYGIRVNDGQWHLLAATKRGTTLTFYVDGDQTGTGSCLNVDYSTSIPLRMGWSENTTFAAYQGSVDELRLYKRALEPREIKALYNKLPVITHPKTVVAYWGRTATFSTTAVGAGPFSYRWFKDDQPIAPWGANAVLTITNVQAADAGFYSVRVSNSFGTVYSQPAELVVPVIGTTLDLYPGVTLDGVVGQTYCVQSSTNLSNPGSWIDRTNITMSSQLQIWFDPQPARSSDGQSASYPVRYYRVVPGPIPVP